MKAKKLKINADGEGVYFLSEPSKSNRRPRKKFIHAKLEERVSDYLKVMNDEVLPENWELIKALAPKSDPFAFNDWVKVIQHLKQCNRLQAFEEANFLSERYFERPRFETLETLRKRIKKIILQSKKREVTSAFLTNTGVSFAESLPILGTMKAKQLIFQTLLSQIFENQAITFISKKLQEMGFLGENQHEATNSDFANLLYFLSVADPTEKSVSEIAANWPFQELAMLNAFLEYSTLNGQKVYDLIGLKVSKTKIEFFYPEAICWAGSEKHSGKITKISGDQMIKYWFLNNE